MSTCTRDSPALDQEEDDFLLDEVWVLYFHDPKDPSWTTNSYVRVATISSARDYKSMAEALRGKLPHGMFFLMREQVFPCWDDTHNIEGGCVSLKISKSRAEDVWNMLSIRMLSETLLMREKGGKEGENQLINGISISPKSLYCVVKVWMSKDVRNMSENSIAQSLDIPAELQENIIFRFNRDVIGWSQTRAQNQINQKS